MKRYDVTVVSVLLALLSISSAVQAGWVYEPDQMHFDVIDLGSAASHFGEFTAAYSINDYGQVVATMADEQILFKFNETSHGEYFHLGFHQGPKPEAMCINDAGQVVWSTGEDTRAMLREPTGETVQIGAMESYGFAINNLGQVVGSDGFPFIRATLFDVSGQGNNINLDPFLEVPNASWAFGINDKGQIVGQSHLRATLFDATGQGNSVDLGTLGGTSSRAISINDSGQIVGWAQTASDAVHATLFDITGQGDNVDLGTLSGESIAFAINDDGVIVGRSGYGGTLFTRDGPVDLNTLIPYSGWNLLQARDINNDGWIAGQALYTDGYYHAVVLKPMPGPVPEPGTLLLLVLGTLWLRRRRAAQKR